ncbi:MAG: translation initiation factor [Anaerolineae bacterium]
MPEQSRVVYSTDGEPGARCPRCGRAPCRCPESANPPPQKQIARLQRERKGRGGKTVTVISGLQLPDADLEGLAKKLKAACGTGGTVREGTIELQGDLRERAAAELQRLGYRTKLAGG